MKSLKILIPAFSSIALLALPVAHGNIIQATDEGNLFPYDSDVWDGEPEPTAGNTDTWNTNGFNMALEIVGTFHGGELLVTGGSILAHAAAGGQTFGFQAITFDNGGIRQWRNGGKTYDLNGQQLTFGSGGALFTSNNRNRNIVIDNAVWVGGGNITFQRVPPVNNEDSIQSNFAILPDNTLSGYTGTITLEKDPDSIGHARLVLHPVETTGSFGVVLGPDTSMTVPADHTHVLRSLVLDGEALDAGIYGYDDFTPEQRDFLVFWGDQETYGQIQIVPAAVVEAPKLTIQRADENEVRISWPSDSPGWTLQSSADLDSGFADAEIDVEVEGDENVAYDTTTDPRQFYRLILADGPIAVFVEDFEDGMGDWTTGGQPDQWEIGVPTTGPGSAFSGSQVAATRLNGNYETGEMQGTVSWLRSPVIDLTGFAGAGLSFREFMALDDEADGDGNPYHFATISVLDADSMDQLGELTSYNELISEWTEREIDLSAFAGREIVLQFGLATDEIEEFVQAGWYLDDVTVTGRYIP